MSITLEDAHGLFNLDHETGVLTWRIKPSRRIRLGAVAGSKNKATGYIEVRIKGKGYGAHRIVWLMTKGEWPAPHEIDHKDLVRSNNAISNLRRGTVSDNRGNHPVSRRNGSGLKGAFVATDGGFQSSIRRHGINYHLGSFKTAQAAHEAYCNKARELFGEFWRGV